MKHYVCTTGGRDFQDSMPIFEVLDFLRKFYGVDLRVLHGGAKGADRIVQDICEELNIPTKVFPAKWNEHSKAAGAIRNNEMADYLHFCRTRDHTVQVVAFPGGKGTLNMIDTAHKHDIPVDRIVA